MRINIKKQSNIPIYKQIENYYKNAIQTGQIPTGTKLPATRRLSQELGINRLTVDRAYENLKIDGLIKTIMGSGTFTLKPPAEQNFTISNQLVHEWKRELKEEEDHLYNLTSYPPFEGINFSSGSGDPTLFPYDSFRKTLQTLMRKKGFEPLTYGDPQGLFAITPIDWANSYQSGDKHGTEQNSDYFGITTSNSPMCPGLSSTG